MDKITLTPNALDPSVLTDRQRQVIHFLLDGLTNQEIAHHLKIRTCTVKWHLMNIYKQYKIKTRGELLSKVLKSNHLPFGAYSDQIK